MTACKFMSVTLPLCLALLTSCQDKETQTIKELETLLEEDAVIRVYEGGRSYRISKYLSVNAILSETDTTMVNCTDHDEFAEIASEKGVVCGLAPLDWETFRDDASVVLERLNAQDWQPISEGAMTLSYFDVHRAHNFRLTFTLGGFVTVVPVRN